MCWVRKKKLHNMGAHTIKLSASTKAILWLTRYKLFLTIVVYEY